MTTSQAEEYSAIRRVLERGARPPRGQAVPRWPGRLIQVIAVTAALVVASMVGTGIFTGAGYLLTWWRAPSEDPERDSARNVGLFALAGGLVLLFWPGTGVVALGWALAILAFAMFMIFAIIFIERGQRRITVNYAKRQQGRKMYQAQSSHLPLKVNMAGVIPAIFASSILLFPASIAQWFGSSGGADWLQDLAVAIGPGQPLNILLFTVFVVFFCFFYTALMFNPQEVADNLKRSGAFVPGIRPGQQTANYIDGVLTRLTVFGSAYIALVCLMPQFLVVMWNVPFYLGGTSLLIVVVVVMDFMAQVQSHLMSHQYDSVMKKANLKNYGGAGRVR